MVIQLLMVIFPIHAALCLTDGSTLHEFSMDQNELNSHFDNGKQTKCTLHSDKNILSQLLIRHRFGNSVPTVTL